MRKRIIAMHNKYIQYYGKKMFPKEKKWFIYIMPKHVKTAVNDFI